MIQALFNVQINVNGEKQTVKMERGCSFTNNGGTYTLSKDGILKFKKTGSDKWTNVNQVNMTGYQWQAFQNISNNDGQAGTFTQKDITKAMELYRDGKFVKDMSVDLPDGYKIARPKLSSSEQYVQMDVNYNGSKSATLKFQIQDSSKTTPSEKMKAVSLNDKSAKTENLTGYDEEGNSFVYGYEVKKGNITSYYDKNNKLAGSIETTPDNKNNYYDADGNLLYSIKFKTIRTQKPRDNGEEHMHIYDNNGKLKYIFKFDYNDPMRAAGNLYGIPVEEYNENGKVIRKTDGGITPFTTELDYFYTSQENNDAIYGEYYIN